jgi:hypothetical protein
MKIKIKYTVNFLVGISNRDHLYDPFINGNYLIGDLLPESPV